MQRSLRFGIEFLVVCAVVVGITIALLAAVGDRTVEPHLPMNKENIERTQQHAKHILDALEGYKAQNGEYPKVLQDLVPNELAEILPPAAGHPEWEYKRNDFGDDCWLQFGSNVVTYSISPQPRNKREWVIIG